MWCIFKLIVFLASMVGILEYYSRKNEGKYINFDSSLRHLCRKNDHNMAFKEIRLPLAIYHAMPWRDSISEGF
jgi:hypothetical protein